MTGPSLSGTTVLVTRPANADAVLARRLGQAGAQVRWEPVIERRPTRSFAFARALSRLDDFDWITFTSVHAVSAFAAGMAALRLSPALAASKRVAAVGPVTAAAATRLGLRVAAIGRPSSADGLLAALSPLLRGQPTVLYPRAAAARPTLADGLRRLGARVTDVPAYETVPIAASGFADALDEAVGCVVFCSPSAIVAVRSQHDRIRRCAVACIGPTTASAAREHGLPVTIVPRRATGADLADAVIAHFKERVR